MKNEILHTLKSVPSISLNQSVYLDLLRIVSAQLVFFGHLGSFLGGPDFLVGGRIPIQNLGVVIFFLLSGFLIVRTLPKYERFADFFIDRFARIYLTLVPCLAIVAFLGLWISTNGNSQYDEAQNLKTLFGNLLMIQDIPIISQFPNLEITSFGSSRPLWTLAVEWWLYMFVGWLFLGKQNFIIWIIPLSCVPIAYATFGRGNALSLVWMIGGCLAFLPMLQLNRRMLACFAFVSLTLFVLRMVRSGDFYDFQACMFLAWIFAASLVAFNSGTLFSDLPKRTERLIRIFAGASFSLYLLHYTIIELFRTLDLDTVWIVIGTFAISNMISVLVYVTFDRRYRIVAAWIRCKFPQPSERSGSI